ncbi:MAG: SUMF1/EgtB/PvdO family nonheme iron enzyme [Pseudomonadota bacterium]
MFFEPASCKRTLIASISVFLLIYLAACNNTPKLKLDAAHKRDTKATLEDTGIDNACVTPPDLEFEHSVDDIALETSTIDSVGLSDGLADTDSTDSILDFSAKDFDLTDGTTPSCPPCMVLVNNMFCIDKYEASRPDATAVSQGVQTSQAICAPGVIPWHDFTLSRAVVAQACAYAGKRLCELGEWKYSCSGPKNTNYGYGNTYDPVICNGIDTFCFCGPTEACAGVSPCPYPHCYNQPPQSGPPPDFCGSNMHVTATGSYANCTNSLGVFDMNGNVWEVVEAGDGLDHFRGGAYNCIDSETLHRCDFDITSGISARGFRCCANPLLR